MGAVYNIHQARARRRHREVTEIAPPDDSARLVAFCFIGMAVVLLLAPFLQVIAEAWRDFAAWVLG